jgi:hypothetical protein
MADACLKQRAVLTKDQAIEKFRLSLTHSSKEKRPTAVSVSGAFNISEKTVRDIWSARTWHDDTLPLDVNRTPRPAKKIGRPPGKIDSKPRKPRTVKSLSSTPQTHATDNAEPNSPLYCASSDSSHDQAEIFDMSCDDFPTMSSQPAQKSYAVPPEQMQQLRSGLLHVCLHSAPSIKGHGPFASAHRAAASRPYVAVQEEQDSTSSPAYAPSHLMNPRPSLRLHVPAPPSLHPICGVQHPYSLPPSAYSLAPAQPEALNFLLFLPAQTLPRLPQQPFTQHRQHWQVAATVLCPPGSDFNPSQAHVRPPPPAHPPVPGLLAALLAMPPAAAACLLLAAAAAPRAV